MDYDGTDQTRYLFGLDLIYQDDGSETRYLLTDGLGSVRTELVSDTVETVTTYDPYGNLLAQTGASGTIYGFTGEQHDSASNLLYLRARYFDPALRVFLTRDPYPGHLGRPATLHGYIYVGNNPVNRTDPSGLCEEVADEACWGLYELIREYYPDALSDLEFYNGQYVGLEQLPWARLRNKLIDLQWSAANPNAPTIGDLINDLSNFAGEIVRFTLRVLPGTGDVIDLYEFYSHRDFVTGRQLTYGERMDIPIWSCLPILTAGHARYFDEVADALSNMRLLRAGDDVAGLLPSGGHLIDDLAPQNYPASIPHYRGPHLRGAAGERALEVLYPSGRKQIRFHTRWGNDRVVDWLVERGDRLYAYESKNHSTVVGYTERLGLEMLGDWDLAQTIPGYTPIWIFWDQGPTLEVKQLLRGFGISYVVHNP